MIRVININVGNKQPPSVSILLVFRRLPDFVKGIPVAFDIFLLAFVVPSTFFQENATLTHLILFFCHNKDKKSFHHL